MLGPGELQVLCRTIYLLRHSTIEKAYILRRAAFLSLLLL